MPRANNSYYAILGILGIGPMSGYTIKAWVNEGVGYFWDIDYKQIYPTLKKLVDEGLATFEFVKSGKRPESKVYMITDQGMLKLKDWLIEPINNGKRNINELMLKLFFGHHVPFEVNLEHLQRFKASSLNAIQDMEKIRNFLEKDPIKDAFWHYRITTVMRGEIIYKADVEWCNKAMQYLNTHIDPDKL